MTLWIAMVCSPAPVLRWHRAIRIRYWVSRHCWYLPSALRKYCFTTSGAAPVLRIASLLVLGVTLYAGGWLYRKVDAMG